MAELLMPKATAVWLVENTALSFEQIAAFCGLHRLEIQGIADDEVAVGILGLDPTANGQISREEIQRCEGDSAARLQMAVQTTKVPQRVRRARYTPVSKRQERPNAISWLLKNYEELSDAQIGKLLGTTKATINAVRDRTHWNTPNITPQDPVLLGICTEAELLQAVSKRRHRKERVERDVLVERGAGARSERKPISAEGEKIGVARSEIKPSNASVVDIDSVDQRGQVPASKTDNTPEVFPAASASEVADDSGASVAREVAKDEGRSEK